MQIWVPYPARPASQTCSMTNCMFHVVNACGIQQHLQIGGAQCKSSADIVHLPFNVNSFLEAALVHTLTVNHMQQQHTAGTHVHVYTHMQQICSACHTEREPYQCRQTGPSPMHGAASGPAPSPISCWYSTLLWLQLLSTGTSRRRRRWLCPFCAALLHTFLHRLRK